MTKKIKILRQVSGGNMGSHGKEVGISSPFWGRDRLTVPVNGRRIENLPSSTLMHCDGAVHCSKSVISRHHPTTEDVLNVSWKHSPVPRRHPDTCTPMQRNMCEYRRTTTVDSTRRRSRNFLHSNTTFTFLLQLAVLLLALTSQCSGSRMHRYKNPLIISDATQNTDFRSFLQDNDDKQITGRSFDTTTNTADAETLDFQTLKVVKRWGNDTTNVLLVSGRDYVYMLESTLAHNQPKISYLERLIWRTPMKLQRECILMGKEELECQNFIRLVELMENGELMVCGTNAYSPSCRFYKREHFNSPVFGQDSKYEREEKCRGQCVVPFDPTTASATLYTNTANGYQIFTAVVNDFRSNDPIILRKYDPTLTTNPHWLNDPTFLKIIEYGDKVYVFFREIAKESESGSKEETYARVAQICKDDPGGVNVLAQQWTSFLKARLRCSDKEEPDKAYDNLTSVSDIVTVNDVNGQPADMVFATFTSAWKPHVKLSAICAFSMRDIINVFENGEFLGEYELDVKPKEKPEMLIGRPTFSEQSDMPKLTRSYPILERDVPLTRPGRCNVNYGPNVLYFAKEHPLMYTVVQAHYDGPVFVTKTQVSATQIAIDENAGESENLVIYMATDDGVVHRLRTVLAAREGPKAVLLESVLVGDKEKCENEICEIQSLHVSRPPPGNSLFRPSAFVAFSDYMVQFPLMRCEQYGSEKCCSVDPDCGWDGDNCVERTSRINARLSPMSKDSDALPKTCVLTAEPYAKEQNLASAQTSGVVLAFLFFAGVITGALLLVFILAARRRCGRKRKHKGGCLQLIVSRPVKGKAIVRLESDGGQMRVMENASSGTASEYFDMTKPRPRPQTLDSLKETNKYSLPPSPTPSDGNKKMEFENTVERNLTLHPDLCIENDYPANTDAETFPLVGASIIESNLPPNYATSTAPSIPPKQRELNSNPRTPSKKNDSSPSKEADSPAKEMNPNSNNSNNHYFTTNTSPTPVGILPPKLPIKESSLRKLAGSNVAPKPTTKAFTTDQIGMAKTRSPVKKYQSFAGFDRPAKPPVPIKSPALTAVLMGRPHSLAPPTSVKKLEDLRLSTQSYAQTPPVVRSTRQNEDATPTHTYIPKRRERPPSFRHNSQIPKGNKSPVPVSIPVAPDSDVWRFM